MSEVELSSGHAEALDGCYEGPQAVAEIGDDAEWWQLLFDLRAWGFVAFDDNSEEILITEAGRAALDSDDEGESVADEPEPEYDGDYISTLDGFYDAPVHASQCADFWEDVQQYVANGHLSGPDEAGYMNMTEAGAALLDAD